MSSWVLLVVAVVFHMKLVESLIKQKAIICISNNDRIIKKPTPPQPNSTTKKIPPMDVILEMHYARG